MKDSLNPWKMRAQVNNSILGDGCVIRAGSRINHSVIGLRTLINESCTVDDALIMGADYYETMEECALVPGCLPMGLGAPPASACPFFVDGDNLALPDALCTPFNGTPSYAVFPCALLHSASWPAQHASAAWCLQSMSHPVRQEHRAVGARMQRAKALLLSEVYNQVRATHSVSCCAGANTVVRKCIIDKNARIGPNCKIVNTANVQEANKEEDGYVIKDGIVVVIKSSVFPEGTVI